MFIMSIHQYFTFIIIHYNVKLCTELVPSTKKRKNINMKMNKYICLLLVILYGSE